MLPWKTRVDGERVVEREMSLSQVPDHSRFQEMARIYFVESEAEEEDFFARELAGHEVSFVSNLADVGEDAEALCTFIYSKVDADFLESHPQLRFVSTRSRSTDHLDLAALRTRGVSVAAVPQYSETTVAEHTFALILALSRRLREVMLAPPQAGGFPTPRRGAWNWRERRWGSSASARLGNG